jgi:hypothetical protein
MSGWILIVIFFGTPHTHSEHFADRIACDRAAATLREWGDADERAFPGLSRMYTACFASGGGVHLMGR